MKRRSAWGTGLTTFLSLVAFLCPSAVRANTVITFDDLPDGSVVTNQYHAQGVDFATPINGTGGYAPRVTTVPAGEAASDGAVADVSCPPIVIACPYAAPVTTGTFTDLHSSVSVDVGQFDYPTGGADFADLYVFGSDGATVGHTSMQLMHSGFGFHTLISVTTATPVIASFWITAVSGHVGIDDLTYDTHTLTVATDGLGTVSGAQIACSGLCAAPGPQITCPSLCSATYGPTIGVRLTATPSAGLSFAGWTGDCAGVNPCDVTLGADRSVTALFRAQLTVGLLGVGEGSVSRDPPGLACGPPCTAFYAGGVVKLTASPAPGSSFTRWGGACAASGAFPVCQLPMDTGRSVTANFAAKTVIDVGQPKLQDIPPKAFTSVAVDIAGNGSVTSSAAGAEPASTPMRRTSHAAAERIRCGLAGFLCYATSAASRANLVLHAHPGPGQIFNGWGGACSGKNLTCTASFGRSHTVSASFVSRSGVTISTALAPPRFHVRFARSVGAGALVISGRVGRASALTLELRRQGSAPLLTHPMAVAAGPFTRTIKLGPGIFGNGARLFPGPFIVLLQGRSGAFVLPRALQTVVLPAPNPGVVRTRFAASSENGPPTSSVPGAGGEAWAYFKFQNQPIKGLHPTVSWFLPNGKLVGTVRKPNRPLVATSLTSGAPLPRGAWRVDLRAGGKLISSLRVRVV